MTFLRAIPCPAVLPRRSFSAKMGALAKEDARSAARILVREGQQGVSVDMHKNRESRRTMLACRHGTKTREFDEVERRSLLKGVIQ